MKLMSNIYKSASCVLAFLHEVNSPSDFSWDLSHSALCFECQQDFQMTNHLSCDLDQWKTVKDIMSRPFFKRRWVVQEMTLARDAMLIDKKALLRWRDLLQVWTDRIEGHLSIGEEMESMEIAQQMKFYVSRDKQLQHPEINPKQDVQLSAKTILELLVNFQALLCHDPRDIIFSLCVFDPVPFKQLDIVLDYNMSQEQVFLHFCIAMLKLGFFEILHYCGFLEESDRELPSWVPRWRFSNWSWTSFKMRRTGIPLPTRRASEEVKEITCQNAVSDQRTLRVRGFFLDIVVSEDMKPVASLTDDQLQQLYSESVMDEANVHKLFRQPDGNRGPHCPCKFFHDSSKMHQVQESENNIAYSPQYDSLLIKQFKSWKVLFRTDKGHVGLGSTKVRSGDRVAVIYGTSLPLVLREKKEKGQYTIVGDFCIPVPEYLSPKENGIGEEVFVLV
jgi:Heterokaryon incompatibility protein (HET)